MLTLHSTRYQQRDLFNNLHSSKSASDRATLRFGATIGGGPPSPLRGATQVEENARLSDGLQGRLAATASLRRGSPNAENNQEEAGLVYFQETEAEEIIDMSQLSKNPEQLFVFRDEPESDDENDQGKPSPRPSSNASKFKYKSSEYSKKMQNVSEGSSYNKQVGITLGNSYQSSKKNPMSSGSSSFRS